MLLPGIRDGCEPCPPLRSAQERQDLRLVALVEPLVSSDLVKEMRVHPERVRRPTRHNEHARLTHVIARRAANLVLSREVRALPIRPEQSSPGLASAYPAAFRRSDPIAPVHGTRTKMRMEHLRWRHRLSRFVIGHISVSVISTRGFFGSSSLREPSQLSICESFAITAERWRASPTAAKKLSRSPVRRTR